MSAVSLVFGGLLLGAAASAVLTRFFVPGARWGRVTRDELDVGRFQSTADALGLALTWSPASGHAALSGPWKDANARVSYEWEMAPEADFRATRHARQSGSARTRIEVAVRGLPDGVLIRPRTMLDAAGTPIADPELASALYAEGPAATIDHLTTRIEFLEAVLALRGFGSLEVDSTRVTLLIPGLKVDAALLAALLDQHVRAARAVHSGTPVPAVRHASAPVADDAAPTIRPPTATPTPTPRAASAPAETPPTTYAPRAAWPTAAPPPRTSPAPAPVRSTRPSLNALIRGAQRGLNLRESSRAAEELISRPCQVELEIQRISTDNVVEQGAVVFHGVVLRGTSRISARFTGDGALIARGYGVGESVACDGYVEHYDFMSDHVEITCDQPPVAVAGMAPEPLSPGLPLGIVIARLHTSAPLRAVSMAALIGKPHPIQFRITQVRVSAAYRVPSALQGGVTATGLVGDGSIAVDLRLPRGAPGQPGDTIKLTAALAGWDDTENRLLFDAVPG